MCFFFVQFLCIFSSYNNFDFLAMALAMGVYFKLFHDDAFLWHVLMMLFFDMFAFLLYLSTSKACSQDGKDRKVLFLQHFWTISTTLSMQSL